MGDKDEPNTSAEQGAPGADAARGINPVQHSERGQQPADGEGKGGDGQAGEGTGGRAGEYK